MVINPLTLYLNFTEQKLLKKFFLLFSSFCNFYDLNGPWHVSFLVGPWESLLPLCRASNNLGFWPPVSGTPLPLVGPLYASSVRRSNTPPILSIVQRNTDPCRPVGDTSGGSPWSAYSGWRSPGPGSGPWFSSVWSGHMVPTPPPCTYRNSFFWSVYIF